MPFIGDLDPAAAIAPTDQIPLDQANLDGTTDTRRAPAALFAEWLIGQVTASIGAPATAYTDAALVTAKAYADQVGASIAGTANGHADAVLVSAKSYADGVGGTAAAATSAALTVAKAYADTAIADKATPISSLGAVSTVSAATWSASARAVLITRSGLRIFSTARRSMPARWRRPRRIPIGSGWAKVRAL